MLKRRSFFERLTGVVDDDTPISSSGPAYAYDPRGQEMREAASQNLPPREFPREPVREPERQAYSSPLSAQPILQDPAEDAEGQLAVDVYQTRTEVIVQTMVAGVRPDDLNISITHENVTVSGRREGPHGISPEDYFHSELYWGNFSRTIHLPQEIEPDAAEAIEKHGLLIIRLPKVEKDRQHRLKIKQL